MIDFFYKEDLSYLPDTNYLSILDLPDIDFNAPTHPNVYYNFDTDYIDTTSDYYFQALQVDDALISNTALYQKSPKAFRLYNGLHFILNTFTQMKDSYKTGLLMLMGQCLNDVRREQKAIVSHILESYIKKDIIQGFFHIYTGVVGDGFYITISKHKIKSALLHDITLKHIHFNKGYKYFYHKGDEFRLTGDHDDPTTKMYMEAYLRDCNLDMIINQTKD